LSRDHDIKRDGDVVPGEAWARFCRTLDAAGRLITNGEATLPPDQHALGLRYLADLLTAGLRICVEHADADHPEFCRMIEHTMKWGLDAPDCLYLFAPVSGRRRYRIHGRAGSAAHMDIQVNWGHFAEGDISKWGTVSSIDTTELEIDPAGNVEITLGGERQGPNHLTLDDRAEFVLVRQYFGDWNAEEPAHLAIERIGQGPTPNAPSPVDLGRRYARLCDWMEKGGALWADMSRAMLGMEPNTVFTNDPTLSSERSGMRGQIYCMGNFACSRDEAVVIELSHPDAKFWTVGLANRFWQSLDYATHQSSLNMTQAVTDEDGVVRLVISHDDPGLANWLDPCGCTSGTLIIRCLLAQSSIDPKITRVPRAALEATLPEGSKRMTSDERNAILRQRHAAVLHRYRR